MAEVTAIARAPGEALDPRRWAALAILLVGAFLAPLDFFIVNVALPAMAAGLKASAAEMQLVISGYAVVYAVLLSWGNEQLDAAGERGSRGRPARRIVLRGAGRANRSSFDRARLLRYAARHCRLSSPGRGARRGPRTAQATSTARGGLSEVVSRAGGMSRRGIA